MSEMTINRPLARRWAWRAVAVVPAFIFATFLVNTSVSGAIRLEAAIVVLATMIRPAIGLMLLALLAPLGDAIVPLLGAPPVHHAETLAIAFLAGWLPVLANEDEPRPALPAQIRYAVSIFACVVIASVAATMVQLQRENAAILHETLSIVTRAYILSDDVIGLHAGGFLLEALGVFAAAVLIGRRDAHDRFWLLLALVASGVVAGASTALLALGVGPAGTLARQVTVGLPRYSATIGDVNAAASWYLLLIGVSLGVAASVRSARIAWLLAAAIMIAGVTLSGSGAGVIASAVVLSAAALRWIAFGPPRRKIIGGVLVVVLVAVAIGFTRSSRSANSLEMRGGFTQASLRLIEARPVFGVGAGRYYSMSKLVLPPDLSWLYGRENAHDYYLQIAAELGLLGVAAFVWVIGAAGGAPLERVWQGRAEGVTAGCVCGASAYLVSALTGHPLLVPETAIPFWIVLGVLAAQSTHARAPARWLRPAAFAFGAILLLTAPLRGMTGVKLPPGDYGFGPWRTDGSGPTFRDTDAVASLFVGPTITAVEIPLRLRADSRAGEANVTVWVPGSFGSDTRVGTSWSTVRVPLPGADALEPRQRINLAVTLLPEGAPGTGKPGLDVGQIRLVGAKE